MTRGVSSFVILFLILLGSRAKADHITIPWNSDGSAGYKDGRPVPMGAWQAVLVTNQITGERSWQYMQSSPTGWTFQTPPPGLPLPNAPSGTLSGGGGSIDPVATPFQTAGTTAAPNQAALGGMTDATLSPYLWWDHQQQGFPAIPLNDYPGSVAVPLARTDIRGLALQGPIADGATIWVPVGIMSPRFGESYYRLTRFDSKAGVWVSLPHGLAVGSNWYERIQYAN